MKKAFLLVLLLAVTGCGSIFSDSPQDNLADIQVLSLQATASGGAATIGFTANMPVTAMVEYGTNTGSYLWQTTPTAVPAIVNTLVISNLGSDITYYARVTATSPGFPAVQSAEFSFTTASSNAVSIPVAGSISNTSAAISWTTAMPSTHLVEYGTASGSYPWTTTMSASPVTDHSVTLTGLTAGTTYYYRVWSFASSVGPVASAEQSLTTVAESVPTAAQKQRGIWIVGGLSNGLISSPVARVDLYDPVTGNWHPGVTTLSNPVSFAAVAGFGGKLYVIGGFNNLGVAQNTVQIYDIATSTWTNGAGMSYALANMQAVVASGKIYVLGGTTAAANAAWAGSRYTLEYNTGLNQWTTRLNYIGANNSNRFLYAYDDVVYNLCGKSATSTFVNSHDGYVITANALSGATEQTTSLTARIGMAGALYDPPTGPAVVILVGGFSALANTGCYVFNLPTSGTALSTVQLLYSPFTAPSTWQSPPPLPASLGFGAAAVYGNTLYYFGGSGYPAAPSAVVYSYSPINSTSGSWSTLTSMEFGRFGHAAVTAY